MFNSWGRSGNLLVSRLPKSLSSCDCLRPLTANLSPDVKTCQKFWTKQNGGQVPSEVRRGTPGYSSGSVSGFIYFFLSRKWSGIFRYIIIDTDAEWRTPHLPRPLRLSLSLQCSRVFSLIFVSFFVINFILSRDGKSLTIKFNN